MTGPGPNSVQTPRLRLVSRDNGVGLSRDLSLLAEILRTDGVGVETAGFGSYQFINHVHELALLTGCMLGGQVPVQLFIERVYRRCLPLARRNMLMPNPEWFLPKWERLLPQFERVLCKTRHAETIFSGLGCKTVFTGFTSADRFDPSVPRERAFFHLAGRSAVKGTDAVLAAWRKHPQWPRLTVVQHPRLARPGASAANIEHRADYIGDDELRRLQNAHRFHLCPSEAEGFGHYLVEALSVGAVTLVTDAAPMNELVTPERGLWLPVADLRRQGLVDHAIVDVAGIETGVEQALAMDEADCDRIGTAARAFFVDNDRAFRQRFTAACGLYCAPIPLDASSRRYLR